MSTFQPNGSADDDALAALPPGFLTRLREIVPAAAFPDVAMSFTRPQSVGFRVNTLLAEVDPVLQDLREAGLYPEAVPWLDTAYLVPASERERLLASAPYRDCGIYVQNLSSMVPVLALDPQPGERILDLTAAPGSKTLQIAARVGEAGEIAAVEIVRSRFFKLRDNLARQGAGFVRTFLQNGERVWRYRPEYFDRVLLDAPCSTEGRFRTHEPESFSYWSPRKIDEMVRKQRRLLFSAVNALRPGGRLVYSTCTFAPEENEGVVSHALERFGDALEVEPIALALPNRTDPLPGWSGVRFAPAASRALRVLPSHAMEGFFVCSLAKKRSTL